MKVRVYYNLTKHIWSVQKHVPGKGWRVAGHLSDLHFNNVKTVVNDYGQQQTRVEGKKYVHALLRRRDLYIFLFCQSFSQTHHLQPTT